MFTPRPYTDQEIDDYRDEIAPELYAKRWHEAFEQIDHNDIRDKLLAKAITDSNINDVGQICYDVIKNYVDEHYIEPKVKEWAERYRENQLASYGEYLYENHRDSELMEL